MERSAHRVAVVLMCEAEGYGEQDAAAGAVRAVNHLIQESKVDGGGTLVPSSLPPRCPVCGSTPPLTSKGRVWAHVVGETWSPKKGQRRCDGSGQAPHVPREPVIGFEHPNGYAVYARVHDVMDAGMAAGNGHLWLHPTLKAYRGM